MLISTKNGRLMQQAQGTAILPAELRRYGAFLPQSRRRMGTGRKREKNWWRLDRERAMASHVLGESEAGSEPEPESRVPPVSAIQLLPQDAIHNVVRRLDLRAALACAASCRLFRDALSTPPFPASLPQLRLLALRHPRPPPESHAVHVLDPARGRWLRLPLAFLSFPAPPSPVAASSSLLLLWVDAPRAPARSLVACNPFARAHRVLPPLGSAWSRHGTVLAAPGGGALILTELAVLACSPGSSAWLKFSLNLPSKPRSPILLQNSIFTLCDAGSPWRSYWKLFSCPLKDLGRACSWAPLERHEWGDVFDILKRPRLVPGTGGARILMVGGLRSSFAIDAPCSTVLILRLDLKTMEWDEAGRMPAEMYRCFAASAVGPGAAAAAVGAGNNKVKVFGGDGMVWFSGKSVRGKLVMWKEEEEAEKGSGGMWRWVEGVPGYGEGVYRGFMFDAGFTMMP